MRHARGLWPVAFGNDLDHMSEVTVSEHAVQGAQARNVKRAACLIGPRHREREGDRDEGGREENIER